MAQARPAYLTPKATKLPEGHDDTLDAPPPVDAESRSVPLLEWPVASAARGGTAPPEGPIAPPPTDPALRSLAPFSWGGGPVTPNRAMAELVPPAFDLDPDVALWPVTIVQRWPFTGPPTVGIWPLGWIGVDNTATMWVCTQGGQPGTWANLGTGTPGPPGAPGPQGPPGVVMSAYNTGPAATATMGPGVGATLVTSPSFTTISGHLYVIRAFGAANSSGSVAAMSYLQLQQDGVAVANAFLNQIDNLPTGGFWLAGSIQRLFRGDGAAHTWGVLGFCANITNAQLTGPANACFVTVEDFGAV